MRFWARLICLAACFALLKNVNSSFAAESKRPNIILILADDLGFSDLGCYGGEIDTPNLDRLATNGLRFTQFYNATRCCPTRASMLTGLYPHQAGIGHMMEDRGKPGYRGELNEHGVTLAEVLKSAGYRTAMSGKWHVSRVKFTGKPQLNFENNDPFWTNKNGWPMQRGFEEFFGTIHGVNSFFDPFSLVRGNEPIRAEGKDFYYTDAISDHAVACIEKFSKTEKPFFLFTAYTAPHWPLQALPQTIEKYKGRFAAGWDELRAARHARMIKERIIDGAWPLSPRHASVPAWSTTPNQEWEAHRMAVYAAMVDRMDQGIGRIVKKLEALKIADNTLIMFLSDNGACSENLQANWYDVPTKTRDGRPVKIGNKNPTDFAGPDDVWQSTGPGWANVGNTPFRSYKHWTHEGGIATPFIAHWPAKITAPGITHQPAHLIDLMPTLIELAGARYPKKVKGVSITPSEGQSLAQVFKGKNTGERTLFWEHEGHRAVRRGNWKLVAEHNQDWELYDLEKDRTELENLAAILPKKGKELLSLYEAWAKRCGVVPWSEFKR